MEDKEEDIVYLNPLEDRIIGVIEDEIYFKPEHRNYIIVTKELEYLKLVKEYIKSKRDFCKRYDHFCGVFGEFYAEKYTKGKDITLNEYIDEEYKKVSYPTYIVTEFDEHCDMEHG